MVPKNSSHAVGMTTQTALALALASIGQAPVHAQSLEGVVVTATRAEQRSFDAPAAIQSINRDTIENAGPQVNLSESLSRVPGLTILNRQNYAQDLQVSIRGFGSRASFGIRGIRLLIDGIPATTPDGQGQGSSISLTSTDRIEVLRGPLALMYGNSSGGVIQAFTRDAPEQPEFGAQYYTGSYGMHRSDWQYAGRVGDYGLVADYSTFDTNGYRDNSQTERKQFNGKLSFNPNEKTRVNVVFNQFDMPLAQDPLGLTAAQLAANPQQAGTSAISARVRKITSQNQLGTSLTHTLDADRTLTARAYYGTRENLQYQSNSTWVGLNRDYYGAGLQYTEQTKIGGKPVLLVAGYEFDSSKERRQGGTATGGEKTPGSLTRNEDNMALNSDFFVQATTQASEKVSVITGLRSSTVRFSSEDYFLSDGSGSGAVTYRATSPVLGVTFHATDDLNLYANYGKGFETPTLAEVAYTDSTGATPLAKFNPGLSASSNQHYELGVKWLPSHQSRVDFNLFQIDSTDEIVVSTSAIGRTAFKNAPGTSRRGVELSASTLLTPHVSAMLSSSWIDAQFSQAYANNSASVAAGNKLPGIPQNFLFSELLWSSRALGGGAKSRAYLGSRAGLELTHAGKIFANDVNTASAEGYTTLNAKFSHGWAVGSGNLTAYARIDNLTDQNYVGSVIVNQASSQFYEPAPGRNWTLGLRLTVPL
jgi:iron complex outermembrane receptor protein